MDVENRLKQDRDRYSLALIQGETVLARSVISEALSRNTSHARILLEILAPSLIKIGELWHEGVINVAQEHLATTITMETMDFLRDTVVPRSNLGVRAVVTPVEGDQHNIGARMIADFLHMDGWDVDFLGSGTPAGDLVDFAQSRGADLVALSSTLPEFLPNVEAVADRIHRLPPTRPKLLLGGGALEMTNEDAEIFGCDAVASNILEAVSVARSLVGLTQAKPTLEEQLASIGRKINATRTSRKMTQQQLADASGLERTYISLIENGRQNLTIEAALKIANALEVSTSDLLSQP